MSKKNYSNNDDEYIRINNDKPEDPYISIEHNKADGLASKEKSYNHEEYRNEKVELEKYNEKVTGATPTKYFCVFRVGKKIKDLSQVQMFEKHMERDMEVPNADPLKKDKNIILIGDGNVYENVRQYIYGIKLRSNANIGVDLILTSHHEFFNTLTHLDKKKWIEENVKFLKDNFSSNCLYAVVHFDETAIHVHALIVPRFWNEEKKRYELRSNVYFDGKEKMQNWQTQYANYMSKSFNTLIRGVRGSKARHMSIQTWYSLTGKKLNIKDKGQVLAYAQKAYLLEKRVKELEGTLNKMNENGDTDKLLNKLNKENKKSEIYKKTIREIMKKYDLKQSEVNEIVDKVQGSNKKERER